MFYIVTVAFSFLTGIAVCMAYDNSREAEVRDAAGESARRQLREVEEQLMIERQAEKAGSVSVQMERIFV